MGHRALYPVYDKSSEDRAPVKCIDVWELCGIASLDVADAGSTLPPDDNSPMLAMQPFLSWLVFRILRTVH